MMGAETDKKEKEKMLPTLHYLIHQVFGQHVASSNGVTFPCVQINNKYMYYM